MTIINNNTLTKTLTRKESWLDQICVILNFFSSDTIPFCMNLWQILNSDIQISNSFTILESSIVTTRAAKCCYGVIRNRKKKQQKHRKKTKKKKKKEKRRS